MRTRIDPSRFGPWALVTGASSGIGLEFARQLAASGLNLVLVARRQALLDQAAQRFEREHGVQCRVVVADLAEPDFMARLAPATRELEIGLLVSNAGTGNPGPFLRQEREALLQLAQLNALAHVRLAHHYGQRMAARGRGGIVLGGAMGAQQGIPYMAGESGAKSFVQSFGEALHAELKPAGVHVTVLVVAPTQTAIIDKFGVDPERMPMKPMSVQQCVAEGLQALARNRAHHLPGRVNRWMNALVPAALSRRMMGRWMQQAFASRGAHAQPGQA